MSKSCVRRALWLAAAVAAVAGAPAGAATWNVTDVYGLDDAMSRLGDGDEVILAPGTYDLTKKHTYCLYAPNVTIRGQTGNAADVVIWGGGMNNQYGVREAFQLYGAGQTIRDLTIEGFFYHALHFQPGSSSAHVYNVRTLNIGEQHMKGAGYHSGGVVEYCYMNQTETRLNGFPEEVRPDEYVGGIDLINGANGWIIRDNLITNIQGALGDGDAGIFLWQNIDNCVVERNVVVNVNKGIALGNPSSTNGAANTIVRNNFIVQEPPNDVGIEVCYTVDCQVLNNTIYHTQPYASNWSRTLQIYGSESGLEVVNNIIRGNVRDWLGGWSNADVRAMGNIVDDTGTLVTPAWFEDAASGNLHLTALAGAAIDTGTVLGEVLEDIDTGARPPLPDLGADEYLTPHPGDANRDEAVNVLDLGALANNYRVPGPHPWTEGDFNLDRAVNVLDLGIMANYYRWSQAGGGSAPLATDGAPVPEPAAVVALVLAAALRRRRRVRGRPAGSGR